MTLVVGVIRIPHRYRHHSQRSLKLLQRLRLAHAEPLLEHLRTIEARHTHGEGDTVLVEDDGAVHATADVQPLLAERAVGLFHLQRLGLALKGPQLSVEQILSVFHGQAVKIDGIDRVDRASPARVPVESDDGHRKANLRRAELIVVRPDLMHLHVPIEGIAPRQMRIDDQHRLAARRMRRADRPRVGSCHRFAFGRRLQLRDGVVANERADLVVHPIARAHVAVVDGTKRVFYDVDARHRKDNAVLGADRRWVRFRKIVDPARERVEVGAEGRVLRGIPCPGALGDAIQLRPPIEIQVRGIRSIGHAPIFRRSSARFAVQPEQQVGLIVHLRPAVRVKHRFAIGREDVWNAVTIP